MFRLAPLVALVLLSGCASLDLADVATRAAGDAVGRAVLGAVNNRTAPSRASDAIDAAAAEFGSTTRLPERLVPGARLDTADVVAWAARELGVELRRTGTSPAGADGGVLLRYQQARDGVPVVGGFYVAEALPGADTVATLAGTVFDDLGDVPRRPRRDTDAAVRAAGPGDAALVILARTHPFADEHKLAWRVRTGAGLGSRDVFVDAQRGRVLGALPLLETDRHRAARQDTVPVVVALPTVYHGERTAMGADVGPAGGDLRFQLRSRQWGGRVGAVFDGTPRAIGGADASEWPDIGWRNGAYDAFWGLHEAHSHLAGTHGWSGISGRGTKRYQVLFGDPEGLEDPFTNAAYWASENTFIFGWSSPTQPYSELTVVGHELGHAVDHYSADLTYFGEPGAVDEAVADIRGIATHRAAVGSVNDWRIGTQVGISRSLRDPKGGPRPLPDTYEGDHWVDVAACVALPEDDREDECGVHTNSGVGGRWFYLLVEGGEGENDHGDLYDVDGIGFDLAERVVHRAHTRYLGPSSDYDAFRAATVRAASDLTGERVGTCDTPTLDAVQRAWHAVGVGPAPCRCVEGSFTTTISVGGDEKSLRMYVRDGAIAAEVPTSEGTVHSRSRMGGATVTMRGAVDYRGTPTDQIYDAAGLPRRDVRVDLPDAPLPAYDALEDAWNAARTGRTRPFGTFTAVEYDWRRVADGVRRAGVPVEGRPSGTVWTVRDVCLSLLDVQAGPTQLRYGRYEQRQSWLGFMGLPVEFGSRDGAVWISDFREHAVSDDIIGR